MTASRFLSAFSAGRFLNPIPRATLRSIWQPPGYKYFAATRLPWATYLLGATRHRPRKRGIAPRVAARIFYLRQSAFICGCSAFYSCPFAVPFVSIRGFFSVLAAGLGYETLVLFQWILSFTVLDLQ
jgi:hypothetical protein